MDDCELRALVEAQKNWMVDIRRRLHRIPERGFAEVKTQQVIMETLDALGIPYTTERTWVVGVIEGALPGQVVALRADMDALPLEEPEGLPFRSEHPGMMHACGHDAHMTMVLGAAKVLMGMRDRLPGTVKLLFQPAEETDGGAEPMVQRGVMENPHVDRVYGLHVQPYLPVGVIETRAGTLNASTDDVELTIHGRSSHGAYPESGADAIVCAAQVITSLQTLVSRNVSPLASAVLSLGMISGGTAGNIICDRVSLRGTLRTANGEIRAMMKRRIAEVASGVAAAMGCTAEVCITSGYAALVNDEAEAGRVMRVGARLLGEKNVVRKAAPSMGGEDFSFFCERVPGAFFHLGCVKKEDMPAPLLHSRDFHLDEDCLTVGAMMHVALVLDGQ
ncbi:MAG: M20 family metallopeptidase [Clostridiales bacterium]|nr:M20 family metallopeptidase [Clostridiales bacterium]MDY3764026.1 M20 family metallopeptidase [Candidatus Ventricola sp.]MCI6588762.1 M20 family metallopeptidase [Clostridiales bacterium]MDY3831952.1 M20 family metallopeptidase [Candidatus Ventricola sp.]MDY4542072.1 M20 family metallopeptidase [Candidatus Ventricola sp.]